jgi:adenosylhomocysteine nucleosidase
MYRVAIIAALQREISPLIKNWTPTQREYEDRTFTFFEGEDTVAVCGGIGMQAARRAAEAVIALYHPMQLQSAGFAGALNNSLHIGDIFSPAVVIDARDGSRHQLKGDGTLLTFMSVADVAQKTKLALAYAAAAVDMEAAAVASAAQSHDIPFGATKVISDELDFEIPGMERFISPEGHFRAANFVLFASLRPWLWKSVAMLARNSSKASQALCAHLRQFCGDTVKATAISKTSSAAAFTAENPLPTKGGK